MGIERFYTDGHKIKRPAAATGDTLGDQKKTWSDHLAIKGKLWQLRGDERLSSDKITYFADARLATYIADIKVTDRYEDLDGNLYNIKAVAKRVKPDGSGHLELDLELIK